MVEVMLASLISPFTLKLKSWFLPVVLMLTASILSWGDVGASLSTLSAECVSTLLLSLLAGVVVLMMAYEGLNKCAESQSVLFFLLLVSLTLCFLTMSAIQFYLWFEFSLVPMAILILGWGAQPERLMASLYMLFYTICASLPLLFLILAQSTFWFFSLSGVIETELAKGLVALGLSISFMVKFPMYLVHLWLPKAHVEAPCTGSMFLAGVLLKLGGFGLYRFNSLMAGSYTVLLMSFGLAGAGLAGFVTLIQNDIKSLIAYSSVVHMGLIISSLVLKSPAGLLGAFWMMVAHGFCSSGLFCIGTMVYERAATRNLLICQGLLSLTPGLGFVWALTLLMNASAPPSLNLFSEVLMIWSCVSLRVWLFLPIGFILFVSLAYGLYLYAKTFAGLSVDAEAVSGSIVKEYFVSASHLSWLSLAPVYIFMWLSEAKGSQ